MSPSSMALLLWRGCPAAHDFAGGLIAICVPLMVFCTAFCGPNRPAQMPRDAASQASRDAAGTQTSGSPGGVPWGGGDEVVRRAQASAPDELCRALCHHSLHTQRRARVRALERGVGPPQSCSHAESGLGGTVSIIATEHFTGPGMLTKT